MKFVLILWSLMPILAAADVYTCGSGGLTSPESRKAYAFLSSIQGRFQLGRCFIELQMCDQNKPMNDGNIVGDMGVTSPKGQFFYLTFDFSNVQTARVKKVILNGRRMMHYEFIERLPNASSGRTEAYRLEILKSEDLSRVESLDLGFYYSRVRERFPHLRPGRGAWINCGASEE